MEDKVMQVPGTIANKTSKLVGTEALGSICNYRSWHAQSIQDEVVMHCPYS